jgi:hypothetical protein
MKPAPDKRILNVHARSIPRFSSGENSSAATESGKALEALGKVVKKLNTQRSKSDQHLRIRKNEDCGIRIGFRW